jgi:hypothetical protein
MNFHRYVYVVFPCHVVNFVDIGGIIDHHFKLSFHNSLLVPCQAISSVISFKLFLARVNYKILPNIDMD